MPLSPEDEVFLIEILNFITGLISVVACIWLFSICSQTPRPWPISLKLILVFSLANFIYSICNFVAAFDSNIPFLCTAEAIVREWSLVASLYWACCIAILTNKAFTHGSLFNQRAFFNKAVVSGVLISLFFCLLPIFTEKYSYGSRLFGCWVVTIDEYRYSKPLQLELVMTFFGIPAILSLIITLKVYADIARKFKELQRHFIVPNDIGVQKLFWYPAVIFLSCIPALVDNIVQIYFDFSLQSLNVIHVILFHSLGFSNALVYGLQRRKFEMNRNLPNRDSVASTENQDRSLEDIETIEARIKRNSLDASLFKASVATPF